MVTVNENGKTYLARVICWMTDTALIAIDLAPGVEYRRQIGRNLVVAS